MHINYKLPMYTHYSMNYNNIMNYSNNNKIHKIENTVSSKHNN